MKIIGNTRLLLSIFGVYPLASFKNTGIYSFRPNRNLDELLMLASMPLTRDDLWDFNENFAEEVDSCLTMRERHTMKIEELAKMIPEYRDKREKLGETPSREMIRKAVRAALDEGSARD